MTLIHLGRISQERRLIASQVVTHRSRTITIGPQSSPDPKGHPEPYMAGPNPASSIYCFGEFRFDSLRRVLFKGAELIPIPERLSVILIQLLQANGAVVTKEALALRVWPHEAVSDGNLAQHVYMLRRLLGERARDHSCILSVSGGGYRFALPVTVEAPALNEPFTADAASLGEMLLSSGVEPFRNYCQGSFLLEQRTAPSMTRAIESFEAALRANPDYTPALIGLARSHALLAEYWHVPAGLAFPLAGEAIRRALELDPMSWIAHAVRSELLCFCDWDWDAAREENDLAIALNPGSTFVRNNAAWLGICTNRYDDALAEAQIALMLEPSSLHLQLLLARVLVHSGDYRDAIAVLSSLLETDPHFYIGRRFRAQAYLLGSDPGKALGDLRLLPQERSEDPSFRLPMLGRAYAELGELKKAEEVFETLVAMARTDYVVLWNLAIVATGIGRLDEAIAYLEAAFTQREPTLLFLRSLPWFEPLRDDRRFQQLLEKVGPA